MVVLLVILTVLGCVALEWHLRRREKRRRAEESPPFLKPQDLFPGLVVQELPSGLFIHSGHTWAKLDVSGSVQVGLDGFAQGILGRIDRYELPANGTELRQGEPAFAALQSGKKIEFVSPVDGVVCAVNDQLNAGLKEAKEKPYEKGWAFAIHPLDLTRNMRRLRIGPAASEWLAKEVQAFSEFLALHRAVPEGVGVTLPDGGAHAEGIMETMNGEILQIAIRKFFR